MTAMQKVKTMTIRNCDANMFDSLPASESYFYDSDKS
jgi:hypothetical protein